MQRHIILSGFMGSGKSTVGRILSRRLSLPFHDVDDVIEKQTGMKIMDIFSQHSEAYFRELETRVLRDILATPPSVIATGGGTLMEPENLTLSKQQGVLFYLSASAKTLHERVRHSQHRPLVKKHSSLEAFARLLEARIPFYKKCDYIIDADNMSPDEVATYIQEILTP
ncbi:shikimate kinase [Desulfurispirillum indicum]|uniref:Shikimate kinase n=1 Tax=Desulfurispirillum indicum (strain ATCC BAA-1389 / DSM 22839 / S5) TaxID=653733 RepID=E6W1L1_DESIS|nr:shikimate kinase [Desulfurispirillum indicum]ADU66560.1 Shikimate kinase [Desulfurispirillum indicum S5]UCZ55881.1 shikimate kinase [Desulfurispirillum indicum]